MSNNIATNRSEMRNAIDYWTSACPPTLLFLSIFAIVLYLVIDYLAAVDKLYYWNMYHTKGVIITLVCLIFAAVVLTYICNSGYSGFNVNLLLWAILAIGGLALIFLNLQAYAARQK